MSKRIYLKEKKLLVSAAHRSEHRQLGEVKNLITKYLNRCFTSSLSEPSTWQNIII